MLNVNPAMLRRTFLSLPALAAAQERKLPVRFGIDLFSIRSQGWNAFECLDYCAKQKANVVFFSENRFFGSLEEAHLKQVREHARKLGVDIEVGMRSICPSSKAFDPNAGAAEAQLQQMLEVARITGSPFVRCVLGTVADRQGEPGIEGHIANTVKVLHNVRSRFVDGGVKIAIENHAGDMQARELKMLIDEGGKDFVGACIDSGNPVWTIEDPHLTLETLAPYGLASGVRDSAVWRATDGIAVRWTRMGEGNVDIERWVRRYVELCPGKTLALEIIVTGPRTFAVLDPKFWDVYRKTPAWEFSRFLALAEKGKPQPYAPPSKGEAPAREREDLEASARWVRDLFQL